MTEATAKRNYAATGRRCVQVRRTFQIIEILKSYPHSLSQLRSKIGKLSVSERTIRRDLTVLVRLGWVEPFENQFGTTNWRWVKK